MSATNSSSFELDELICFGASTFIFGLYSVALLRQHPPLKSKTVLDSISITTPRPGMTNAFRMKINGTGVCRNDFTQCAVDVAIPVEGQVPEVCQALNCSRLSTSQLSSGQNRARTCFTDTRDTSVDDDLLTRRKVPLEL